jgi:hypothetical protein
MPVRRGRYGILIVPDRRRPQIGNRWAPLHQQGDGDQDRQREFAQISTHKTTPDAVIIAFVDKRNNCNNAR